mmetsp:Transcript_103116/g.162815  ORF Transcript_103116/g.162815 Transcript_103116/m.162815 type:complete len:96 (-) Transcript_103116:1182-1469(-)
MIVYIARRDVIMSRTRTLCKKAQAAKLYEMWQKIPNKIEPPIVKAMTATQNNFTGSNGHSSSVSTTAAYSQIGSFAQKNITFWTLNDWLHTTLLK